MIEIPIWEKSNLTLEEAAAYSGIGINKLRKLSDSESCPFVLWIGSNSLLRPRKIRAFRYHQQKTKLVFVVLFWKC